MQTLSIGDLIVDNYGREGIVYSRERRPNAKWLANQDDVRVQNAEGPWWKVLPLDGGAVILPEDLGNFIRRATVDDLQKLVRAQQSEHAGTVVLTELFKLLSK